MSIGLQAIFIGFQIVVVVALIVIADLLREIIVLLGG